MCENGTGVCVYVAIKKGETGGKSRIYIHLSAERKLCRHVVIVWKNGGKEETWVLGSHACVVEGGGGQGDEVGTEKDE